MRKRASHRGGFTLVELLVVIGIIALLISILLPVLNKAKESANTVKCAAQQKSIMTAMVTYCMDNKGAWPRVQGGINYVSGSNNLMINWETGVFLTYIAKGASAREKIFNCPSDMVGERVLGGNTNTIGNRNYSYSFNHLIWSGFNSGRTSYQACTRVNQVKSPTHKIVLIEERAPQDSDCWIANMRPTVEPDLPTLRHNYKGNMGFADGHVETLAVQDMGYGKPASLVDMPVINSEVKVAYYFRLDSDTP